MIPPAPTPPRLRRKVAMFTALCAVCLALAVGYGIRAADRSGPGAPTVDGGQDRADLAVVSAEPRILFQSTKPTAGSAGLTVVSLVDAQGPQAQAALECDRVDFSQGLGVCLTPRKNIFSSSQAVVFDRNYQVVRTLGVPGLPSRVRLSPDGRLAAVTSFVNGDSYAAEFFSTRTTIIDVERGKVIEDLERFTVTRQGQTISEVDFNFWGVTFTSDNNRFYATLGTGSHRYLVEGDLASRTMNVLRDDVECPSLSPDGTRIAFKRRVTGGIGPVTWRLSVLDVETLDETPLAETENVDDQAEWLDNNQVLYGIRPTGTGPADTRAVPADGTGAPSLFISNASSAVVVEG